MCFFFLPCMNCIGFTASGIARGSLAAIWHSCIGLAHAGSYFAQCQAYAAASSPCGCIAVCLCWVTIIVLLALWLAGVSIFGHDSDSGTNGNLTELISGIIGENGSVIYNSTGDQVAKNLTISLTIL